ncbi:MBL fold metallo-hydrolase [Anthocerotibacter panamensis]|uniref:MBL fold metallo-hydrolase n=1 Tax=Anthocerotibacter panamensis TaxID=2857077 RepID=UPI001C407059|nr:MBL fold metallo-hydrolase [Anthocerotibacter panamensis]
MHLTRIDLNSWLLRLAARTVLIDPWLVDPLTFYGMPFLFEAEHRMPLAFTPQSLPPLDLILVTQGLDDHCHEPTLAQLDRRVPFVGSRAACRVARRLGFRSIHPLTGWEEFRLGEMSIQAVPGAMIQNQTENGYRLSDGQTTLYYEPHEATPQTQQRLAQMGEVDVLLIPVVGQIFPLLGEVIMGPDRALEMVKTLRPRTVVPTSVGAIKAHGILPHWIRTVGSLEAFARKLAILAPEVCFRQPAPGETLAFTPETV